MSWVLQTTGPFSWLFNFHDVSSHLNDLPSYTISNLIHDFLPFLHRYDDEKCIKSMKKKKLGIWNLLLTDLEYQLLELWVNTLTLYQSLIKFLNLSWNLTWRWLQLPFQWFFCILWEMHHNTGPILLNILSQNSLKIPTNFFVKKKMKLSKLRFHLFFYYFLRF